MAARLGMSIREYLASHTTTEHRAWMYFFDEHVTREELLLLRLYHIKLAEPRPRLDEIRGPFFVRLTVPEILTRDDGPVKPLSDEDFERLSKRY